MSDTKPALPEPVPPNAEGSTTCIVRWMVTTRDGLWLGAWDKEAFAAYTQFAIDAAVAEARAEMQERIADQLRTIKALMVGMPDEGTTPVIRRIAWLEQQLAEARAEAQAYKTAYEQSEKACRDLTEKVIPNLREQLAETRAVPDGRNVCKVDPGFRWDGDAQQHVPQVLVEFAPVPANAPNDSPGWLARDAFVAALSATPSPAEPPKPAVRAEKLYDAIKEVLLHHRLSYTEGEDAEAFPLVDMLCPPGSRDISKGRDEITLICDAIYNDEAVRAAISGEQP